MEVEGSGERNIYTNVSRYIILNKLHTVCGVREVSLVAGCFCEGCWFVHVLGEPVDERGKYVLPLPPAVPSNPPGRICCPNKIFYEMILGKV